MFKELSFKTETIWKCLNDIFRVTTVKISLFVQHWGSFTSSIEYFVMCTRFFAEFTDVNTFSHTDVNKSSLNRLSIK